MATENIPNVRGVAQSLKKQSPSHPHHEQWVSYARSCVKGGLDYINAQLSSNLKPAMEVFKCCRLFSLHKVREITHTCSTLDESLSCILFYDDDECARLKDELPTYLARVADLDREFDPVEWWKINASTLPHWSMAAQKVILVQPSLAAAERVFSLLKASFGDQQDCSLKDFVESSLMLQYNKH